MTTSSPQSGLKCNIRNIAATATITNSVTDPSVKNKNLRITRSMLQTQLLSQNSHILIAASRHIHNKDL
jgi:hypothetical protein